MELDSASQSRLIEALKNALAGPGSAIQHLHTHISHVLLVGEDAYKIKKPVDLGFLDFSTLARRRHFCEEEIRLNGRLAPDIYRDVVPITGPPESPRIGGAGEALEYAVRMRRFPQEGLLSGRPLDTGLIQRIAERVAAFHAQAAQPDADSPYGRPDAVLAPMRHNFAAIRATGVVPEAPLLGRLHDWTESTANRLLFELEQRRSAGHIRECHGDLHLGNIALDGDTLIIFDGIEFDPFLRWIDTFNDCAFLLMDLEHRGESALASRFLNRYLELGGDYPGLAVLDFYRVYRAMVRVKVESIRLGQTDLEAAERRAIRADLERYLDLADCATRPGRPALVITHGVSGCGKSHAGASLVDELGAVRVRSDVERKRLFGLGEHEPSSRVPGGIYNREATLRTYGQLREAARRILQSGRVAVVDAACLLRVQRDLFRSLARELACPFLILVPQATPALLAQRLEQRMAAGQDPSEADAQVQARQIERMEPLQADELEHSLSFDSTRCPPLDRVRDQLRIR